MSERLVWMLGGKLALVPRKRSASLSLALSSVLLLQAGSTQPTAALALSLLGPAKKAPLQTPVEDKLLVGSGPATTATARSDATKAKRPAASSSLAPLRLGEKTAPGVEASASTDGYLKSTVTTTKYMPKGLMEGNDNLSKSSSVIAGKGKGKGQGTLIDKAKSVNCVPIPLEESDSEVAKKVETELSAEQQQLADLWEATLARSQDINFVVQKLMPSSDPGRGATVLLRLLNGAIYGAMSGVYLFSPTPASVMMTQGGGSALMNLLNMGESKIAKNARLSQTEAIMLYNIVRNTAKDLVTHYRDYKKVLSNVDRATTEFEQLQQMVRDGAEKDAAKQIEIAYTLNKAQRELDGLTEDVRRERQHLIDLAGGEAVDKLDQQIQAERIEIASPQLPADRLNQQSPPAAQLATEQEGSREQAVNAVNPKTASKILKLEAPKTY